MTDANMIYARAVNTWGIEAQLDVVIEECSELINAIEKCKRGRNTREDVVTEIADVMIVAEQAALIFGADFVRKEKARKIARLEQRLDKYDKEHGLKPNNE